MATPPDPGQPEHEPVLEPTRVIQRPRSQVMADFADLFRGPQEGRRAAPESGSDPDEEPEDDDWEPVPVADGNPPEPDGPSGTAGSAAAAKPSGSAASSAAAPAAAPARARRRSAGRRRADRAEQVDETPPTVRARGRRRLPAAGRDRRQWHARIAGAVVAAGLVGFGVAQLLPRGDSAVGAGSTASPSRADDTPASPPVPPGPAASTPAPRASPDVESGVGLLREGDAGPAVADLQVRLLRVPDVYAGGSVNGRFDAQLTSAVARFQEWYGIRGDETGVYGDDTRRDLEALTEGD
ncbi:peptidoglycan-binding domain-containing protein [Streptomyces sp. 549]|uniref:peptidoglycan-binding domain-containing protein n=1 Tax=Streptomyces sp. 549 TaxID=3049076 RepID=UPI0024C43167|nr:peptidoglycan-binding domain-containing protein [Streptomyces sp. 549]MDK1475825.1 peptidoglycan-binding domain-containing protein [Streptomyces sp. 549]